MESTTLASPAVRIQSFLFMVPNASQTELEDVFGIIVDNAEAWADKGWGGSIRGATLVYINPVLDNASAKESITPLIDYGAKLGAAGVIAVLTEYPTWGAFFDFFSTSFPTVSHTLCPPNVF